MIYEPDIFDISRSIAASRGRCDRCAAFYRHCCCDDDPAPEFDADDEPVPDLPQHIAERIQAMRAQFPIGGNGAAVADTAQSASQPVSAEQSQEQV